MFTSLHNLMRIIRTLATDVTMVLFIIYMGLGLVFCFILAHLIGKPELFNSLWHSIIKS